MKNLTVHDRFFIDSKENPEVLLRYVIAFEERIKKPKNIGETGIKPEPVSEMNELNNKRYLATTL